MYHRACSKSSINGNNVEKKSNFVVVSERKNHQDPTYLVLTEVTIMAITIYTNTLQHARGTARCECKYLGQKRRTGAQRTRGTAEERSMILEQRNDTMWKTMESCREVDMKRFKRKNVDPGM